MMSSQGMRKITEHFADDDLIRSLVLHITALEAKVLDLTETYNGHVIRHHSTTKRTKDDE